MRRRLDRGATLAVVLVIAAASPAARAADSRLETGFFHYRSGTEVLPASEMSGVELRWALVGAVGSFRIAVPALSLTGSDGLAGLGPSYGVARRGSPQGAAPAGGSQPAGLASGLTARPGDGFGTANPAGTGDLTETRRSGLGDVRMEGARQVTRGWSGGRLLARGGVKLPTADESQGLGTGETDAWGGLSWKRGGWNVDTEAWVEWVRLGDPDGVEFQDGPAAGFHLDWRRDHGGFGGGMAAGRAALEGDPTRISALVGGWGAGRSVSWSADASIGLTDSAPDLGVTVALRFR